MVSESLLLLLGRILLGAIFGVAGATKVQDGAGTRKSLTDFGLPAQFVGVFALLLPLAELAIAAALLFRPTAVYGAVGALVLLLIFIAGIAATLARGRQPDCHCFGQLHSAPVSGRTIARNGALGLVAGFVATAGWANPGPGVLEWLRSLTPLGLFCVVGATGAGVFAIAQSAAVARLRRTNAELQGRLAGAQPTTSAADHSPLVSSSNSSVAPAAASTTAPTAGIAAPAFALENLNGETITLEALRAPGIPIVLMFSDPNCGPCTTLLPEIAAWRRQQGGVLNLVLVSRGTREANRAKTEGFALDVLLQRDREVLDAFGGVGTPSAIVIRPDGTLGSGLAQGEAGVRRLLTEAATQNETAPEPMTTSAPDLTLTDLEGESRTIGDFKGQPTLVLFWNPGCGYCQRMLKDLRAWDAKPAGERVQLLVVSTGSVGDNRALGLTSTVVLDPHFMMAPKYGIFGTPSAVLLDADGQVSAPAAVGVSAVLALAGQPESHPHELGDATIVHSTVGPRPDAVMSLPLDARPVKQECVQDELLSDGSMVLYNGCRQEVLTLNPTAAFIWEHCDGDFDVDAIAAEVRAIFPTADGALEDVRGVVDRLVQAGMVAPAETVARLSTDATGTP